MDKSRAFLSSYAFPLRVLGILSLSQSLPDVLCLNTDIITWPWLAGLALEGLTWEQCLRYY